MQPTPPRLYLLGQLLSLISVPFWAGAFIVMMLLVVVVINPVTWLVDHLDSWLVRLFMAAGLPTFAIGLSLALGVSLPLETLVIYPMISLALFVVFSLVANLTEEDLQ
jgi:hypothetical protein